MKRRKLYTYEETGKLYRYIVKAEPEDVNVNGLINVQNLKWLLRSKYQGSVCGIGYSRRECCVRSVDCVLYMQLWCLNSSGG